ncbi:MAG: hypothetical protein AAF492_04435, partial [Verrucomicrobiota bacterium]
MFRPIVILTLIPIVVASGDDFGDLPAIYQGTTMSDFGARHTLPATGRVFLGALVDSEADGIESDDADGDDLDAMDDEDGIRAVSPWIKGANGGAVDVTVTGGAGFLSAWIDWNGNGNIFEPGDQIYDMLPVPAGRSTNTFDIPSSVSISDGPQRRFTRFR